MINIGNSMYLSHTQIQAILDPKSSPVKKMMKLAEENGTLYDATKNEKTASVIVTINNILYLSYITPKTLCARIKRVQGVNVPDEE